MRGHAYETLCVEPVRIRAELFTLWLNGSTTEQAIAHRSAFFASLNHNDVCEDKRDEFYDAELLEQENQRLAHCIQRQVHDSFNVFNMIESMIQFPSRFRAIRPLLYLDREVIIQLVERYYTFDDSLLREIAGQRFSTKSNKDVVAISERAQVVLHSAMRQIESLRRIMRALLGEDERDACGLIFSTEISKRFCLPESNAEKIGRIIFLSRYRFETLRRRIRQFNYNDIDAIAGVLMQHWTKHHSNDIDYEFIEKLRDLKGAIARERSSTEQYRRAVEENLSSHTEKAMRLGAKVPSIFKALIMIANDMKRRLKDLFSDVVEHIVNPLCRIALEQHELKLFFSAIVTKFTVPRASSPIETKILLATFARFVRVIELITGIVYAKYLALFSQRIRWRK